MAHHLIHVSVAEYIEMRKKMTNEELLQTPLFVSSGDEFVYCDNDEFEGLKKITKNFTIPCDNMLIIPCLAPYCPDNTQ